VDIGKIERVIEIEPLREPAYVPEREPERERVEVPA
jgi:hypothetical protein